MNQAAVYGYEHDPLLWSGLKRRSDFKSLMSQQPLLGWTESINDLHQQEETALKATIGDPAASVVDDIVSGCDDDDDTLPTLDTVPEVKKVTRKAAKNEDHAKQLAYWKTFNRKLVEANAELCEETESDDVIIQRFKNSAAGKARGSKDDKTYFGVFYNPNLCGESSSQPASRKPPLRNNGEHLKRLMALFLRTRDWELDDRDLLCLFDVGREG